MIGAWVRFEIQPGKTAEFETLFEQQLRDVRREEDGNIVYELLKSQDNDHLYYVYEIYQDEAAFHHHMNAPHILERRADIRRYMVAGPKGEVITPLFSAHRPKLSGEAA